MQVFDLLDLLTHAREEADGSLLEPDPDRGTALAVALCEVGASVTIHEAECRVESSGCDCSPTVYGPKLGDA